MTTWSELSFWGKVGTFEMGIAAILVVIAISALFRTTPMKKLEFIMNAQKNGCFAFGTLSCFLVRGKKNEPFFLREYHYQVRGKDYFVTYKTPVEDRKLEKDDGYEKMDGGILTQMGLASIIVYYDKKHPGNAMSKYELFVDKEDLEQVRTPRKNPYRRLDARWENPLFQTTE